MFKRREQAFKRSLVERAQHHLAPGEEVRVIALAQGLVDPRLMLVPIVTAAVLINGSLIGDDNYLPAWSGYLGIVLVVAASIAGFTIPRRFLLRTDEHAYMFELPRRRSSPVGAPLSVIRSAELPPVLREERSRDFSGERIWANPNTKAERYALTQAVLPPAAR